MYTNAAGLVVCPAAPQPGGKAVNAGNTPWFQKFLKEKRFTVGQPHFDRITGRWVSVLSAPVWNERQEMAGAIHLPLEVAAYDPDIPVQFLPAESRYGFFSQDGIMIWRNLDPESVIGTRPDAAAARRIVEVRNGEFESLAVDGVTRYFSVEPMPKTGWIAFVGVPASVIYGAAKQRAITAMAIALAAIAILVLIAVAVARRIATPVAQLEITAHALHGGDFGVRAAVGGPREVALVAQEFNAMIDAQQRSAAQLRIAATAFESQQGMMITDASEVILQVNSAFTATTGYTAGEAVGQTPRLLSSGRHDTAFYAGMWESIKHTGVWQGEIWDRRKNGEIYPKWLSITAVKSDDGAVTHYVGAHTDITASKQAEAARASLEVQLRESQKLEAIGTLAGGIAHDFNNIIATILGNAELARQDAHANPLALESLEEISKAGRRARDLVQQILSFSRRQPIERKLAALAPILAESVRLLRAALPARLIIEVHCDADAPPVLADATQIQQLVINLCTNAMQAMRSGPGRIGIRLDTVMLDAALADTYPALRALQERHPVRVVRLAVSDNGPGMDAATIARIFEPFFTTKAVGEGTGLGLSVVHGIVQTHGGGITVDSQPGTGSTFTIYLPAAAAQAVVPGARQEFLASQ